jgi:uncharacterized protein YqjF (DUF2071 family)
VPCLARQVPSGWNRCYPADRNQRKPHLDVGPRYFVEEDGRYGKQLFSTALARLSLDEVNLTEGTLTLPLSRVRGAACTEEEHRRRPGDEGGGDGHGAPFEESARARRRRRPFSGAFGIGCARSPARAESERVRRDPINVVDRLSVRTRPPGLPIMHQHWGSLLFMHWPVPADLLRPLIPEPLSIDTYDGLAWVGITPFTMWGVRPAFTPPLPSLSESHELNVRTYVHLDGVPGVWCFSLDANNAVAALGARVAFHLPYFNARMSLGRRDRTIYLASRRAHRGAAPAAFEAVWTVGEKLPQCEPGSLKFFLIERYCLYSARGGSYYRVRILHSPWPLHAARLLSCRSTMMEAQGLPSPVGGLLLHQQGEPLKVRVWPKVRVR